MAFSLLVVGRRAGGPGALALQGWVLGQPRTAPAMRTSMTRAAEVTDKPLP